MLYILGYDQGHNLYTVTNVFVRNGEGALEEVRTFEKRI